MLIAGADSGSASRSTTTVSLLETSSEQFHLGHTHSHWTENGAAFTASRSNLVECRRGNENIPRPLWENDLANDEFRTENRPSNLISYIQPGPPPQMRRPTVAFSFTAEHLVVFSHLLS